MRYADEGMDGRWGQKLRYAGDLCVACVRAYVCVYVCVCIRINFSSLGRGVLWMVFVVTSFVFLFGSAGVWTRDLVHARHVPRHCTIRLLLRFLFLCYCSMTPDAGSTASKFSKLFFCLPSCFFLSILECLCQWVGNEFRSRRRVGESKIRLEPIPHPPHHCRIASQKES